ncbi:TolC family protein [Olivibacter sp. XZL3]|uniref:TolC family protein n=1 Tax=Olivibacter sp. XZL3 TaxID=1735116 RepID=UPI0010668043|nr:TolC family protein [Olivibacter sp. XZL3]
MIAKTLILFLIFSAVFVFGSSAQTETDTLRLLPKEAEQIFLENNLSLIAARLNIEQADALILQAKAWPNPNLGIDEVNLNRNSTSEAIPPIFGNFARNQQFTVQLEQLILTAKKRKRNINLEVSNKQLAESAFIDFLQSLKVEFRTLLAQVLYNQETFSDLARQVQIISRLVKAQEAQLQTGNTSQASYLRLKALQIELFNELKEAQEEHNQLESNLKTLMAVPGPVFVVLNDTNQTPETIRKWAKLSFTRLVQLIDLNNSQLKVADNLKEVSVSALAVEKAKRIPDLTFNLNYDRNGSTMFNFFGAGLSFDLPIFDRNKGNIKQASLEVKKHEYLVEEKKSALYNQLEEAYKNINQSIELYKSFDPGYLAQLENMQSSIANNLIKRNLSLLEFIDLFDSFKKSKSLYFKVKRDIQLKECELSYLVGQDF